jgi:hypothetical protein
VPFLSWRFPEPSKAWVDLSCANELSLLVDTSVNAKCMSKHLVGRFLEGHPELVQVKEADICDCPCLEDCYIL